MFDKILNLFHQRTTSDATPDIGLSYSNLEIQDAKKQIKLLKEYINTKSKIHKKVIFNKFNNAVVNREILSKQFASD